MMEYIFGSFWIMFIICLICPCLILVFPYLCWRTERKDEQTLGQFVKFLRTNNEGFQFLAVLCLIPYINIGLVIFTYLVIGLTGIYWKIVDSELFAKFRNCLYKIKIK